MGAAGGWRRYAGPAAFLLAVTVAVLLIRSGIESGHSASPPSSRGGDSAATTTTATTTTAKLTRPFWIVKAGDTLGLVADKTGVPLTTIEQLNPNVSSTSLYIGQKLRLR